MRRRKQLREAECRKAADYSGFLCLGLKKKKRKGGKVLIMSSILSVSLFFISQQINCAETLDFSHVVIRYYSAYDMEILSGV